MSLRLLPLVLGAFAIGSETFMISGVLPTIAGDLGVSPSAAGSLVTVFALAYAFGSLALARRRLGGRRAQARAHGRHGRLRRRQYPRRLRAEFPHARRGARLARARRGRLHAGGDRLRHRDARARAARPRDRAHLRRHDARHRRRPASGDLRARRSALALGALAGAALEAARSRESRGRCDAALGRHGPFSTLQPALIDRKPRPWQAKHLLGERREWFRVRHGKYSLATPSCGWS